LQVANATSANGYRVGSAGGHIDNPHCKTTATTTTSTVITNGASATATTAPNKRHDLSDTGRRCKSTALKERLNSVEPLSQRLEIA
jgi:hypothetical protein